MSGYFIFGDVDTRNYEGVYVAFDDVDTTPKRVYEEIEIPSRNGLFYMDKGRYEDVEHVYHVISLTKENGSDLINALASKIGYHRLEDSFNTEEYYEAVFTSGAELNITTERDKNTFKVTFTRKPQRFLKSGETATSVSNNGTITNPTRFDSSPLVQAWGYGGINIGNYPLMIENTVLGNIVLTNGKSEMKTGPISDEPIHIQAVYPVNSLNDGDTITVNGLEITIPLFGMQSYGGFETVSYISPVSGSFEFNMTYTGLKTKNLTLTLRPDVDLTFTKGTNVPSYDTSTFSITFTGGGMISATRTYTFKYRKYTSGQNEILDIQLYADKRYTNNYYLENGGDLYLKFENISGYSTVSTVGNPTYLDMDTGEVYKIDNGEIITMNNASNIGSELATLPSGSTTVTYDNTITQLKIVPRWWIV